MDDGSALIVALLGGTALLLYGVRLVGEGLQRAAGTRLRHILQTLSGNRLRALLVGAGVTAVLQSSSATTVMLVGFASAGLLSLRQTIGVILPEATLDQADALASKFREMVQQRLVLIDHKTDKVTNVTVSAAAVGTDLVQADIDPGYILAEAEAAVLRAKMNGGNRVERVALLPTSVTFIGAATLLGVTVREVVRLVRGGALRASRRGRHFHIDRATIEEYRSRRT